MADDRRTVSYDTEIHIPLKFKGAIVGEAEVKPNGIITMVVDELFSDEFAQAFLLGMANSLSIRRNSE